MATEGGGGALGLRGGLKARCAVATSAKRAAASVALAQKVTRQRREAHECPHQRLSQDP